MSVVSNKFIENDEFLIDSIRDITIDFKSNSGTDDDNNRYFGFNSNITAFQIRSDQIIQISEVNGQVLKNPITINTNKPFIASRRIRFKWENLKLKILTANTNVKISAFASGRKSGD